MKEVVDKIKNGQKYCIFVLIALGLFVYKLTKSSPNEEIPAPINGYILETYPSLEDAIRRSIVERFSPNSFGFVIVDENEFRPCADAVELFYEDEHYRYYFACIKSHMVYIVFQNGNEHNIREALGNGIVSITQIEMYFEELDIEPIFFKINVL